MAADLGLEPNWTRIGMFLPVNNVGEIYAVDRFILYVKRHFPGLTYSQTRPNVFLGWYWDEDDKAWIFDQVAWLMIDAPLQASDRRIAKQTRMLQLRAQRLYKSVNVHSPQKAVWVSVHSLMMRR